MANTRFADGVSNCGVANTGVSAVEYGDSRTHTTVLTISQADALTVADNAALSDGYLLYTFPAGALHIHAAHMDVEVNHADGESAAGAGELGLGSTAGSGANATLGAVATTAEDICGPLTSVDTADAAVSTVLGGNTVYDDTATHYCYFNIADTWGDVTGTDLNADIVGTVTLVWSLID
jgi:hypothetical protein